MAYAQQYASNGNIPTGLPKNTFGIISQIAKELPKADGTLVDKNTGIKSSAIKPTQEDAILAAYNLKTNVIPELKKAYDNVNTGLLPGLFGSAGIKTQAMTHFEDVRTQFLNQLLLANSGKVVSDKELKDTKICYLALTVKRLALVGLLIYSVGMVILSCRI